MTDTPATLFDMEPASEVFLAVCDIDGCGATKVGTYTSIQVTWTLFTGTSFTGKPLFVQLCPRHNGRRV